MNCVVNAGLPMYLLQCDFLENGEVLKMAHLIASKFAATFTSYDRDRSGFTLLKKSQFPTSCHISVLVKRHHSI